MTDAPLSTAAAVESLWGGVRIVVIDLETTHSPTDRHDRALSFAAVTCRAGTVRGKWQTLINPGVPIDRESRAVHGLTDAHLEGEPMFADVADQLLPLFSPADGETLVVAGHNVGYDISVLRGELSLVGRELPDVPVLDTMRKLPALADVHPDGGSLAALLATLELTNARPHDALADATACAEALVELLRRAADRGHTDFDTLLEEVSGGATTATIRSKGRIRGGTSTAAVPALPPEHTEGHTTALSRRAGVRMLAACMRGTQSVHTSCGGAPRSTRARPASRCARAIRFIKRAQGVVFAIGVNATTRRANPGYSTAHASACIPPMEAPTTA